MGVDFVKLETLRKPVWLIVWHVLTLVIASLMRVLTKINIFMPLFRDFVNDVHDRKLSDETLQSLLVERNKKNGCVFFFCSSAGEFEQALPVIDRIESHFFVLVIFFSTSGVRFFKTQGLHLHYILSPLDQMQVWERLFHVLRPSHTCIVRHELWPCFVYTAFCYSQVWLINAVALGRQHSFLKKTWIKSLYVYVHKCFVVNDESFVFFTAILKGMPTRVEVLGDTKYERAMMRADRRKNMAMACLPQISRFPVHTKKIVCGSVWPKDWQWLSESWSRLGGETFGWQLVLVLHEVTDEYIRAIEKDVASCHLTYGLWSKGQVTAPVVIVDALGVLSDLYSLAHAAFVGGAVHFRVHNVLEPFVYGVPIAHGPKFYTSHEAIDLQKASLSSVVTNVDQTYIWLRGVLKQHFPSNLQQRWRTYIKDKLSSGLYLANQITAEATYVSDSTLHASDAP